MTSGRKYPFQRTTARNAALGLGGAVACHRVIEVRHPLPANVIALALCTLSTKTLSGTLLNSPTTQKSIVASSPR
jgi:hypothetical protein